MEQPAQNFPNVPLEAIASADGRRVTVIFPAEFIGRNVCLDIDKYSRMRIITNPMYNGQSVIGFVNGQGVKQGKVEFNPSSVDIDELRPSSRRRWNAKQREYDLLIGTLISDLAPRPASNDQPQPYFRGEMFGEKFATGEHRVGITSGPDPFAVNHVLDDVVWKDGKTDGFAVVRTKLPETSFKGPQEPPMTLASAIDFINEWVAEGRGTLLIEDGFLCAEVKQRIGGRKS